MIHHAPIRAFGIALLSTASGVACHASRAKPAPFVVAVASGSATPAASSPANAEVDAGSPFLVDIVGYGAGPDQPGGKCVLYVDGRVACWRAANFHRAPEPSFIEGITDATSIAGGPGIVTIVRREGSIDTRARVYPKTNSTIRHEGVEQLADGCMRMRDGTVPCNCWGDFRVPLPAGAHAIDIASGGNHACVAFDNGDVTCWGQSLGDVLGEPVRPGFTPVEHCPTEQATLHLGDAVQVAAGARTSCARRRSGAIACWGGRWGPKPKPIAIPQAVWLRSLNDATCAITRTGEAWCWGSFLHYGVGDKVFQDHEKPVRLPLEYVTAVDASVECAIIGGARVTCWDVREGCSNERECLGSYDVPMPR